MGKCLCHKQHARFVQKFGHVATHSCPFYSRQRRLDTCVDVEPISKCMTSQPILIDKFIDVHGATHFACDARDYSVVSGLSSDQVVSGLLLVTPLWMQRYARS